MDVADIGRFVRGSWLIVVIATVLGLLLGGIAYATQAPVYRATSQVFVSTQTGTTTAEIVQGGDFALSRVETYANLVGSEAVLAPVIEELDIDETEQELAERVQGFVVPSTTLIEVRVDAGDGEEAAAIANATAESLQATVDEIEATPDTPSPIALTITERAQAPAGPTSPQPLITIGLGLALGLLIGLAVAIARAATDTRVRGERDLERITDAPVIGRIELDRAGAERVDQPVAESFRALRTNLRFVEAAEDARTFLVSAVAAETGASATARDLAIALAESGERVLLVDADLRSPEIGVALGLRAEPGLSDVLIQRATLADAVQRVQSGLEVLPAGSLPPNPSELLGSEAMATLVQQMRETYDTVLFDSPALLPVTDAAVLSQHTAASIVVVRDGSTRRPQLTRGLEALQRVGSRVVGLVLIGS